MKSIESRRRLYTVALWAETAWLVLLGFLILEYVQSGEMQLLLSPTWNWLEMTAGLLGIGIGAGAVLMEKERREAYIDVCCRSGGPADPVYRILGIVLLTGILVTGVIVPGRSLTAGVQTAGDSRLGTYAKSGEGEFELVSEKETGERDFEDWLIMTAQDPEPEHYRGEEVNISGMVVVLEGLREGEFHLVRYLITHCIACARPVGFLCRVGEGMEVPDTDDWVEVHGWFDVGKLDGERVPLVMVDEYRIVERPVGPYVFP
jgi:uncharacterized repeat protein (TIGR03943 family)